MNSAAFLILIGLSAILSIYGKYLKKRTIHYIFKPITMLLIISLAFGQSPGEASIYKYSILTALILSLVGDILLMLSNIHFIKGLISFLLAHIVYIFAFAQDVQEYSYPLLIPYIIFAAFIFGLLFKRLNKLRVPVLFYALIASIMGWLAVNRYLNLQGINNLYVLIGGSLFLLSDAVNALNRFRKPFLSAEVLILGTYFSAQMLLALSIQ